MWLVLHVGLKLLLEGHASSAPTRIRTQPGCKHTPHTRTHHVQRDAIEMETHALS